MERILIIEDDQAIRFFISAFFIEAGYEVKEAQDGEEGIELLKNDNNFKVIVTDIRMPKKDGNAVAQFVRHSLKQKKIPVVAITGFIDEAKRELFDCLLEKPFKMETLMGVIDSLQ